MIAHYEYDHSHGCMYCGAGPDHRANVSEDEMADQKAVREPSGDDENQNG